MSESSGRSSFYLGDEDRFGSESPQRSSAESLSGGWSEAAPFTSRAVDEARPETVRSADASGSPLSSGTSLIVHAASLPRWRAEHVNREASEPPSSRRAWSSIFTIEWPSEENTGGIYTPSATSWIDDDGDERPMTGRSVYATGSPRSSVAASLARWRAEHEHEEASESPSSRRSWRNWSSITISTPRSLGGCSLSTSRRAEATDLYR
eukprot:376853-Amphidinium_carterae.1